VTVHRAKGLEWPTVYLPAVYRNNFPSRVAIHDNPHVRPESLPYEYRIDRAELPPLDPDLSPTEQSAVLKRRHDAQEWRIAYVAVTRAKEAITVTGAHWYGNPEPTKKPAVPSDLYALVAGHQVTSVLTRPGDPPDRPDTIGYRSERLPAPDPVFTSWQHGLRATIDDPDFALRLATDLGVAASYHAAVTEFEQLVLRLPDHLPATGAPPTVTSVTGLVTYASCPLRYYWSDVDRLPRRYSPAARRGVEVHRRIELHHRGVIPPEDIQPTLYDAVVSEFTEEHEDLPESGPFEAFAGSRFAAVRPYVVEAPFEITVGRSTTVRGRIDALYRSGDDWEIVDFKSGRPSSDPSVTVQLQAYALAVSRGGFSVVPPSSLRVTFAYLGEGLVERTRTADPSWLETAQERLDALATGIEEGQFDATPSPACHRCDFLHVCDAGRRAVAT
jgi:DNA helicase-2/ATP-dependent DNA helicase PcrA